MTDQSSSSFWHGTSTAFEKAIDENGLQPASMTGNQTEKREGNLDKVFLAPDTPDGRLYAEGYAIRSSLKFGGKPLILRLSIKNDDGVVRLERKGDVDQWFSENIPHECIVEKTILPFEDYELMIQRMVSIFDSVKHKKRSSELDQVRAEGELTRV